MEFKTGQYSNIKNWQVQTWGERKYSWVNGQLVQQWEFTGDWKPVPFSPDKDGPGWEPVYHGVLTDAGLYVPGFGGTIWKLDRATGGVLAHINPFASVDANTYAVGSLANVVSGRLKQPAATLAPPPGVWQGLEIFFTERSRDGDPPSPVQPRIAPFGSYRPPLSSSRSRKRPTSSRGPSGTLSESGSHPAFARLFRRRLNTANTGVSV